MKSLLSTFAFVLATSLLSALSFADGPADNDAASVRPIPPVGMELSMEQRQSLSANCATVRQAWADLIANAKSKTTSGNKWQRAKHAAALEQLEKLTPEILVFPRAVELALEFDQFYKPAEVESAASLLEEAMRRITIARQSAEWSRVIGLGDGAEQQLIVGGYRSKLDGSFQPYALVIPPGLTRGDSRPRRLDLWFHGRGETLSEVNFLAKGKTSAGQYTPDDTLVLHPYGRYSNAFKFAGEMDVLEALDHVRENLPVDDRRVSVRGFSMGGAACWQFATHYADRFFAANPGAGFSETPEFLKSFQGEDLSVTPDYQRRLWRLYDCPFWAENLVHCPTVAYSGEIDRQKQAADVMEASLAEIGVEMVHVIGPETGHQIHPQSKLDIEQRMDSLAASVSASLPRVVRLTTQTLRYHRMHWVSVEGMKKHWETATVQASLGGGPEASSISVETQNVTRLKFVFKAGQWPGKFPARPSVVIDGTRIEATPIRSDLSWEFEVALDGPRWKTATGEAVGLRKRPGLQGPIDDAFMDSFLFVLPSNRSPDAAFDDWTQAESAHARLHWRKHFRGDVRSVVDRELTKEQIAAHHLILFGDPESNSVIARLSDALPVAWSADSITLGNRSFPRAGHAVTMIYPNPLNPDRYIVLNSGFTFREYDYLNNARQTPKLPDWAILDIRAGSNARDPGKIQAAGFFDESWSP